MPPPMRGGFFMLSGMFAPWAGLLTLIVTPLLLV